MATRTKKVVIIYCDSGGNPSSLEMRADLSGTDGTITFNEGRKYDVFYNDLSPAARARVDDFLGDCDAWLNSTEPLV